MAVDEEIGFQFPSFFYHQPPSIFQSLNDLLQGIKIKPFPYLSNISIRTRQIIMLYTLYTKKSPNDEYCVEENLFKITTSGQKKILADNMLRRFSICNEKSIEEAVVKLMTKFGITKMELDCFPSGVSLPLHQAIYQCRENPPLSFDGDAFILLGREDLAAQRGKFLPDFLKHSKNSKYPSVSESKKSPVVRGEDDGMDHLDSEILQLRFKNDLRIQEVSRLLQTSKPVCISLTQQPDVSDHEFLEEQERYLFNLCIRTMAVPIGRGMFTLRTSQPIATEPLPIPKLCLTGRVPPRNTTVELSHIEVPANMSMWPLFHNGVAAGLKVATNAVEINSTWIVYNKPRLNSELPTEHAGLLMALGLNGHLKNLATTNIYNYISKGQEMTSVGLLIGIAASKRGSMDMAATKLLSIHIEALLPPTSTELDVSVSVRVAAILGIGLLYEGTAHRHTAEVLLSEIGRPPGPEMENSTDRESYSLAAGLALGLVTFGKGGNENGLLDINMASLLCHYMVGGHRRVTFGMFREKFKSPSYQIKEGDAVNVDVTSPGATLALGMMFFASGNRPVAEWMSAPDTQYLLDFVRPDFLLLRTLSKCLILWNDILPNCSWVESHLPEIIATAALNTDEPSSEIDYETMGQAYFNILAGACMALGLRFAGSANQEAYQTLLKYVVKFIALQGNSVAEQVGKSTLETCLNVIVLALSAVMAGTGDLEVLRVCRYLRSRVGQSNSHVLYGSHMATHMALGLLFLGSGKYTLSTSPQSIAVLICALYPKFPAHSNDNRYHLQAFRHLYVLAAEPRLIIPRDVITGTACYTHLKITFKDTKWYKDVSFVVQAPIFIPEFNLLKEITVCDPRYLPVVFQCEENWDCLKTLIAAGGNLFVKQRAGCLSYIEDPNGYRSLLHENLLREGNTTWVVKPESIPTFTSNAATRLFADLTLQVKQHYSPLPLQQEIKLNYSFCRLLYECVTQEKLENMPALFELKKVVDDCVKEHPSSSGLWQIKTALSFINYCAENKTDNLIREELFASLNSQLETSLNKWYKENHNLVESYLKGRTLMEIPPQLANYIIFFDLPSSTMIQAMLNGNLDGFSIDQLLKSQIKKTAIVKLLEIFSV